MSVQPSVAPFSVLVADDDKHIRFLLDRTLCQAGFAPLVAADGHEGVEMFRRHRDEVRVVLLDVNMPGLDGPGALAQIRQIAPQVPCCFMTGYTDHYGVDNLLALGAARVFDKPFLLDDLIETLGELCGRPCKTPAVHPVPTRPGNRNLPERSPPPSGSASLLSRGVVNFHPGA
jgi:CheY-like chemotaxis protein